MSSATATGCSTTTASASIPHGHNAVAEIEVRSGSLDNRNMVCDFSDIKRIVKGWVDRELDHKMILREDDPLVGPLQRLGEPVFIVQSNPTVEHIAKLLYDYTHSQGFPVVRVTVWETPTSFATFGGEYEEDCGCTTRLRGIRSRRHAHRLAPRSCR